jgi:hypothetical protein
MKKKVPTTFEELYGGEFPSYEKSHRDCIELSKMSAETSQQFYANSLI